VQVRTVLVGSLEVLAEVLAKGELLDVSPDTDVVVVPTGAAFTGLTEATLELAAAFEASGAKVEALMIGERSACFEPHFVERILGADLVVLSDGSALHAKSAWHTTPVGEAIRAAPRLVAVGSCASVLGEVMIDPRGGAPTNGLGYRPGIAIGVNASEEQLTRTRTLLGSEVTLAVLGPRGVVHFDGSTWRRASDDVVVTRGHEIVEL
jgi:cyanophycinase-like exopeptidase